MPNLLTMFFSPIVSHLLLHFTYHFFMAIWDLQMILHYPLNSTTLCCICQAYTETKVADHTIRLFTSHSKGCGS